MTKNKIFDSLLREQRKINRIRKAEIRRIEIQQKILLAIQLYKNNMPIEEILQKCQ